MQPAKATCTGRVLWWLTFVLGSLVALAFLWWTRVPLGVPGEWQWERPAPESDWPWNTMGGAVAAAFFVAYVVLGWRRMELATPRQIYPLEVSGWLTGLFLLSFLWVWIVQELAPTQNRLGKAAFVLYFPSSSGYFTRARYEMKDPAELLARYEALMRQGDVLHTGTHPPGLFLVFHGLIAACEQSPRLSSLLDATQPSSFREACDIIESNQLLRKKPNEFLPQDRRVLWLATLLVMLSASATVIPLFHLLRRAVSISAAWVCAALWPAVPAVAIFTPKSDVVFALIGVTLMWVWLSAWQRRSVALAFLSGFLAWCGLISSLAFLPILLATSVISLGLIIGTERSESVSRPETGPADQRGGFRFQHGLCLFAGLVGLALPTFACWYWTDLNLLNVWSLNYQNHAGFYRQFTRTYWKWLLVNPVELSFAVGFPVALLAVSACGNLLYRTVKERCPWDRPERTVPALAILFVWGLLWLTGKNSSEAARLWILLMPWAIWLASFEVNDLLSRTAQDRSRQRLVIGLLAVQFLTCLLTVSRVSGFHADVL